MSDQEGTLSAGERDITTYERFPVFSDADEARIRCMECIIDEVIPEAISDFMLGHAKIPETHDPDQSITYQVSCDGSRGSLGRCAMKLRQYKDRHSDQVIAEFGLGDQGLEQL